MLSETIQELLDESQRDLQDKLTQISRDLELIKGALRVTGRLPEADFGSGASGAPACTCRTDRRPHLIDIGRSRIQPATITATDRVLIMADTHPDPIGDSSDITINSVDDVDPLCEDDFYEVESDLLVRIEEIPANTPIDTVIRTFIAHHDRQGVTADLVSSVSDLAIIDGVLEFRISADGIDRTPGWLPLLEGAMRIRSITDADAPPPPANHPLVITLGFERHDGCQFNTEEAERVAELAARSLRSQYGVLDGPEVTVTDGNTARAVYTFNDVPPTAMRGVGGGGTVDFPGIGLVTASIIDEDDHLDAIAARDLHSLFADIYRAQHASCGGCGHDHTECGCD